MNIRPVAAADADRIAEIYNHYIANTIVTFETEPLTAVQITGRITENTLPWLVADSDDGLLGYAYASKWKGRCAYRYSVESTIYMDPQFVGQGVGSQLYSQLIDGISACGMHVIIGGISLPNASSVRLHEKLGFRKTGHFAEVGFKFERWIDVGYWQLTL